MLSIDAIKNLLEDNAESDMILSLYLNVDPSQQVNQNTPHGWEIFAKNALRDLEQSSEIDETVRRSIRKHVEAFLETYSANGKSLILFVNEEGIIQHFDLAVAIDNYQSFGKIDLVQLLWSVDEYERYLVVLVDREKARFLSAYLGHANSNEEMRIDFDDYDFGDKQFINANYGSGAERQHMGGSGNFDDVKSEHIRRFHSDVAEQIREFVSEMDTERLILGGNERAAHEVKELLHHNLHDKVIDILSLPVQSSDADVAAAIQISALNYERAQELALVNEVIDSAKAGGRGTLGIDAVHDLLEMQQVELLILPYPMDDEEQARQLTTMAILSGAEVELVHGSAMAHLQAEGNVAARLYYPIPEA